MATIEIRNIGPIKEAKFGLNKINVFMGPQSSGKSTIAKIISYCQWVEKRYILDGDYKDDFAERFMEFHRLSEAYFSDSSYIKYESNNVIIEYKGTEHEEKFEKVNDCIEYIKSKNIYIPAERNFVSAIDNLRKYKRTNDNIMNFVYDWAEMREIYSTEQKYPILNLNVSYFYNSDSDTDMIYLPEINKELKLNNASSGLQSITPILLPIEFMTGILFNLENVESFDEKKELSTLFFKYFSQLILDQARKSEIIETLNRDKSVTLNSEEVSKLEKLMNLRQNYHFSRFIIEEPEQNLFPETQRDLIYYLIDKVNNSQREHKLTITTHSPYILYALNNCMLGGLVNRQITEPDEKTEFLSNEFLSEKSWIDPKNVSIWEIEDGKIRNIQDKDNIISENYFDKKMTELTDEYYQILNYYKDEE